MPWCDPCDKYLAPNAVAEDGTCPTCSAEVDVTDENVDVPVKAPWHFWLMLIALTLYLGWRLIEFVIWLIGRL